MTRKLPVIILLLFILVLPYSAAFAAETLSYTRPGTGYKAIILDEADLLTEEEEQALFAQLKELTAYGNFAFWSCRKASDMNAVRTNTDTMHDTLFGPGENGAVLTADMKYRIIYLETEGYTGKIIPKSKTEIITNNVRSYMQTEDYNGAVVNAFGQVLALMKGDRIAQPMKYLSNAAIALMIGLFVSVSILIWKRRVSFDRDYPNTPLEGEYEEENTEVIETVNSVFFPVAGKFLEILWCAVKVFLYILIQVIFKTDWSSTESSGYSGRSRRSGSSGHSSGSGSSSHSCHSCGGGSRF